MSRKTTTKSESSRKKKPNLFWSILIIVIALIVFGVLIWPALKPVGDIKLPEEVSYATDKVPAGETAAGDPSAPVKLEIYSDFQCPACGAYAKQIEPLVVKNYVDTGKVYLIYRAYSFLDQSASGESHRAAEAAFCALDQGAFWKYHDILFANQTGENVGDFSDKRLSAFAEKLGLDMTEFNKCMSTRKYAQRVKDELEMGQKAGVDATPSFFINGQRFKLQTSYNELFQALDNAVAAAQQQ